MPAIFKLGSIAVTMAGGDQPREALPPSPHPSINHPLHRRGHMHKFDMRRPCNHCPFRTDKTAIRFANLDRAKEIAWSAFLFGFPCHTTADYFEDDSTANSGYIFGDDTQHCAGYLIMQIKDSNGKTWPGIDHDQNLITQLKASLDFDSPVFNDLSSFYKANQRPCGTVHQHQGEAANLPAQDDQPEIQDTT